MTGDADPSEVHFILGEVMGVANAPTAEALEVTRHAVSRTGYPDVLFNFYALGVQHGIRAMLDRGDEYRQEAREFASGPPVPGQTGDQQA